MPPPHHARLLQQFETSATAVSVQLALRYSELKNHFSISKFSLFDLLAPTTRRTVAIATATFGNAYSALERLSRDPWNVSAITLLETFGDSELLSEKFIRSLDDLASTPHPPSWPDASNAILAASDRRRSGETRKKGLSATRLDEAPFDPLTGRSTLATLATPLPLLECGSTRIAPG